MGLRTAYQTALLIHHMFLTSNLKRARLSGITVKKVAGRKVLRTAFINELCRFQKTAALNVRSRLHYSSGGVGSIRQRRAAAGQKQSLIAPRCRANLLSNFLESPARSATALNCIASASVGFPPSPVR